MWHQLFTEEPHELVRGSKKIDLQGMATQTQIHIFKMSGQEDGFKFMIVKLQGEFLKTIEMLFSMTLSYESFSSEV